MEEEKVDVYITKSPWVPLPINEIFQKISPIYSKVYSSSQLPEIHVPSALSPQKKLMEAIANVAGSYSVAGILVPMIMDVLSKHPGNRRQFDDYLRMPIMAQGVHGSPQPTLDMLWDVAIDVLYPRGNVPYSMGCSKNIELTDEEKAYQKDKEEADW